MDSSAKKILYIDLNSKSYEVKGETELAEYVGGVGIGLKIFSNYKEKDPIIISVGPLNGFFPYASKTSIILSDEGVIEDIYIGGTLGSRIRFSGLDAIVIMGKSNTKVVLDITNENASFKESETDLGTLGLPGMRSILAEDSKGKMLIDRYFTSPERFLEKKLNEKNVYAMAITGSKTFDLRNKQRYEEIYRNLLSRTDEMHVKQFGNPSCSGCPMGCEMSKTGELGGNVLIHCLVACTYAEGIYSDIGVIFSCLNVLGYDYTHEDLEKLPKLINGLLKEIEE